MGLQLRPKPITTSNTNHMNETTREKDAVMWQTSDEGVAEPALLVEFYNDVITIRQGSNYIMINYESVAELTRLLKSRKKK